MGNGYTEQLSDLRWKTLRERIASRDGRACVQCRGGGELHVHHSHYRAGREPWEYRDSDLFTLCKKCHDKVHDLPVVKATPVEIQHGNPAIRAAKEDIRVLLEQIRAVSGPEAAVLFEELIARKRHLEEMLRDAS